jgi:hypothetical protein
MQQSSGTGTHRRAAGDVMRRARVLTLALGMALPGLAFIPAAEAASAGHTPGENCVVQLSKESSTPAGIKCFGSFTEAVRFATGGTISNAPANAADAVKSPSFTAALAASGQKGAGSRQHPRAPRSAAATGIIIGIEYDLANYGSGGSSLTFFGSAPCTVTTGDIDYQVDLPTTWWDRISSFQTFNVCWAKHYYLQGYGGTSTPYQPSQQTMPIVNGINFDNNARSIRWS